jgi:hypothetical protein
MSNVTEESSLVTKIINKLKKEYNGERKYNIRDVWFRRISDPHAPGPQDLLVAVRDLVFLIKCKTEKCKLTQRHREDLADLRRVVGCRDYHTADHPAVNIIIATSVGDVLREFKALGELKE